MKTELSEEIKDIRDKMRNCGVWNNVMNLVAYSTDEFIDKYGKYMPEELHWKLRQHVTALQLYCDDRVVVPRRDSKLYKVIDGIWPESVCEDLKLTLSKHREGVWFRPHNRNVLNEYSFADMAYNHNLLAKMIRPFHDDNGRLIYTEHWFMYRHDMDFSATNLRLAFDEF